MNYRAGLITGIVVTAAAAGLLALAWSAFVARPAKSEVAKGTPPANVSKILKEEEILNITLTEDAERRLEIKTKVVKKEQVPRTRTFGGEVTPPPGQTILVAAPLNGTLKAPPSGIPSAGTYVKKGDAVIQLTPLLSPDARTTFAAARVDAEGQVENARVAVAAAKIALDRAKQLFASEAGRQRDVDDAQAQFDLAQKTLTGTQARVTLLAKAISDVDKGTAAALTIEAPTDGLLRNVNALAGQNVPSGAALFEVINLDPVWIRVPVFVGEAPELVADKAVIGPLTARVKSEGKTARAVTAPPSANPLAGTVDLYFTMPNSDKSLAPGQRVGVTLTLKEVADDLVVPWSAIVTDVHGGSWVYGVTGPHTFARRRVQVRHVVDGLAVLKSGPPEGTTVVVAGAQELFGTEVGFSK